jgi:hypothetical protein
MGFLYPSRSEENSKKIGLKHWLRVWFLIIIVILLTWYGKIYKTKPTLTRMNDFAVWIMPHKNGLGALVALPNDGNDSNEIQTGLRIWISPPDSLLAFEQHSAVRYRGKNILVIGDSLSGQLRQDLLSTLDSNGSFYWLGPLNKKLMGEDVFAELKIFNSNPKDYVFDLVYEGCRLRFFGTQAALDSTEEEPLGAAILMFKPENENEPPLKNKTQIQSLLWNGKTEEGMNSNHIALNYREAMALISFNKKNGLMVRRMRLRKWEPDY